MEYIFAISTVVLFVVPVVLVWKREYDDGLVGRIALVGLSFSSFIFGLKVFGMGLFHPWPETVLLLTSCATFMAWHLWRFTRRLKREEQAREGKLERRHAHGS